MKKRYKVVLGSLFGDEGKGATVQWLCNEELTAGRKPIVIRFSGGCQAGHTVYNHLHKHICSTFGSGVLLGIDTYLDRAFFFDPIAFVNEYKALISEGIPENKIPFVWMHDNVRVVTPYDVINGQNDSKVVKDGTCGKGIYPTFARYKKNFGIGTKMSIISDTMSYERYVAKNPREFISKVRDFYQAQQDQELEDMFCEAIEFINTKGLLKTRNEGFIRSALYDTLIYEGSQGLLLDMNNGFMPNCTPSQVGLNGIDSYVLEQDEIEPTQVWLVMRPYLTRHGNGYTPKYPYIIKKFINYAYESNVDNEWQGTFKIGMFDMELLRRAIDRHRLDNFKNVEYNISLTHADELMLRSEDGLDKFYYLSGSHTDPKCISSLREEGQWETEDISSRFAKALMYNISEWLSIRSIYISDSPFSTFKKTLEE